jgi:hypothetical protein
VLTVTRKVYYCEHCKRHRLTRNSIEKHEPRCIYNPDRFACGWHEPHIEIPRPADIVPEFKQTLDLDALRESVGGCPACMVAVVVQADLTVGEREDAGFDYKTEVERFRSTERDQAARDVW